MRQLKSSIPFFNSFNLSFSSNHSSCRDSILSHNLCISSLCSFSKSRSTDAAACALSAAITDFVTCNIYEDLKIDFSEVWYFETQKAWIQKLLLCSSCIQACFSFTFSHIPIPLRADSITLLKFPKKITGIVIPHRLYDIRHRQPAVLQQICRLTHSSRLKQLFIRLSRPFFDLPA